MSPGLTKDNLADAVFINAKDVSNFLVSDLATFVPITNFQDLVVIELGLCVVGALEMRSFLAVKRAIGVEALLGLCCTEAMVADGTAAITADFVVASVSRFFVIDSDDTRLAIALRAIHALFLMTFFKVVV